MKNDFASWFRKQHGPRPAGTIPTWCLEDEVIKARRKALDAERLLAAREEYDAREESALYAWQARMILMAGADDK